MKSSYSFIAYFVLAILSACIAKNFIAQPYGLILLAMTILSALGTLYFVINWKKRSNRHSSLIGLYPITANILAIILLIIQRIESFTVLNHVLIVPFSFAAAGIMFHLVEVIQYLMTDIYRIRTEKNWFVFENDGKSQTLKDSLKLLSRITGTYRFLLPEDAKQICEAYLNVPSAISIIGSIVANFPYSYSNLKKFVFEHHNEKYATYDQETRICFSAIELAIFFFMSKQIRTYFYQLFVYNVDEKIVPNEAAGVLGLPVRDTKIFLIYTGSLALLRSDNGFYYMPPMTHAYLKFYKRNVEKT